jgi:3-hydroxyacyl-CoA dehydrogenase/enoyl-CoA hydratase/3-hydroxybutyryl-CoA epimerase
VADDNKIQLGLPEIKVGLFPGGGGTQRLPRLIGAQAALMAISEGKSVRPQEAKSAGLVHDVSRFRAAAPTTRRASRCS